MVDVFSSCFARSVKRLRLRSTARRRFRVMISPPRSRDLFPLCLIIDEPFQTTNRRDERSTEIVGCNISLRQPLIGLYDMSATAICRVKLTVSRHLLCRSYTRWSELSSLERNALAFVSYNIVSTSYPLLSYWDRTMRWMIPMILPKVRVGKGFEWGWRGLTSETRRCEAGFVYSLIHEH